MRIPPAVVYLIGFGLAFLPAIIIFVSSKEGDELSDLNEHSGIPTFISFIAVVIIFWGYSRFRYRKSRATWNSGVFSDSTPFTQDTLLQAYIRLGALMLRQDTEDLKGKLSYLHRYFRQHFENSYTADLSTSLNGAFHNPIELKRVAPWLKIHLHSLSQRSQLLYFLAGLSAVDGSINPREKRFLEEIAHQLDISRKDFDGIMAMYTHYEDAFEQQQERRNTPRKSRSQYQLEKAAKVLGVSLYASTDEIKKAYRSLAKVHHPDKFAGESERQQEIAQERFVQVVQAYELLLASKN